MNVSLDVCSKSLNKREEELCGDTVEIVKTAMLILSFCQMVWEAV